MKIINRKIKILIIFAILGVLAHTAFTQVPPSFMQDYSRQQGPSSYRPYLQDSTAAENLYVQQKLAQERMGSQQYFRINDSLSLFTNIDTVLGLPITFQDTLRFVMVKDTVLIDSLSFYKDVEELGQMMPDGKRRIVVRRKKIPKDVTRLQRYESIFFKTANPPIFSNTTSSVSGDYPLKEGDDLVLTVWGAVEKETRLKINNQGNINVESVGIISLKGTTLAAAEAILKTRLSKIYSGINRGQTFVNLRIEMLSPIKIFILGEVEKPGAYVFHGNTTVFQALYMSSGPNKNGSVRSVQVARQDSIFNVDLYDYLMHGQNAKGAVLVDGDIVFLPRAKILAGVDGAVGRPAIYELKEGEDIAKLLSFAGGINSDAAEQNMILKRVFPDGRTDFETVSKPDDYINGKDSLKLRDGDTLYVFKSSEKSMQNATILGAIKYPGTYQLKPGMTAADLVKISGGLQEEGYPGRVHIFRYHPQGGTKLASQNLSDEKSTPLNPRDTLVVYSLKDMFVQDSVSIGGAVLKPGYYPYYDGIDAKDLILLAGGYTIEAMKKSVSVSRLDKSAANTVKSTTYPLSGVFDDKGDQRLKLLAWDHVEVPYNTDFYRPELVYLSGAFKNPGVYSLTKPEETIQSLIERAGGFLSEAHLEGARFYRNSLPQLDTTRISLADIPKEMKLIGLDLPRALKKDKRYNIGLMDSDSIYVPPRAVSVQVSGEVGAITNVLWKKGAKAEWYVYQAGGYRITGDPDRLMIKYADGSVSLASEADRDPDPGAEVIVPYKRPPEETHWTTYVAAFSTVITALSTILVVALSFR